MTTYITATPNTGDATVRLRVEAREDGYEDALNVDTYELDAAGAAAELEQWTFDPAAVTARTGAYSRYLDFQVATGQGTRTNQVANPSFEIDASGWNVFGVGTPAIVRSTSSRPGLVGSFVGLIQVDAGSAGATVAVRPSATYPIVAGQWAAFSILVGRSTGSQYARVAIQFVDASGAQISIVSGPVTMLSNTNVARLSVASVAPNTAVGYRVFVYPLSSSAAAPPIAGNTFIDGALASVAATEAASLAIVNGPYFEGTIVGTRISRRVSGLTVGQTYRLLAGGYFTSTGGGTHATMSTLRFGIAGMTLKPFYENFAGQSSSGGYADGDPGRTVMVFEFTATATTHEISFDVATSVQGAQLQVYALVVQTTPSTRAKRETYAQVADDALWTLTGAPPAGITRTVSVDVPGPPGARAIGFELENTASGSVPLTEDTFGQRLTVAGLTPGLTYTARAFVESRREPSNVPAPPAPPWVRLVVDGVGSSDPLYGGWQRVRFVATASSHTITAQLVNAVTLAPGESVRLLVHYARIDLEDELTDVRRIVGLTRSDGNGARDVRPTDGVRMEDGTLILTDHEAALTGLVTYTVATQRLDVPDPSTTTEVATAQTRLDVTGNRFTQVVTPRLAESARLVETYDAGQASSGVVHDVIDRADPIVTKGPLRRRRGRMVVWFETYEAALEFTHLFDAGDEVLWRQDEYSGLDMYFLADNVATAIYDARTRPRRWNVALDYVEVAFPTAPVAGDAVWNYRAGAERNATYWDDLREFPTYADRRNGPIEVA